MKKLVLVAAAAAAISAASAATPANALTIIKPGCCGGSYPGGGLSSALGRRIIDRRRSRCRLRRRRPRSRWRLLLCAPQGAGPQYRSRQQAPAGLPVMETTEAGGWKIDDFRGAVDGKIRGRSGQLLVNYLETISLANRRPLTGRRSQGLRATVRAWRDPVRSNPSPARAAARPAARRGRRDLCARFAASPRRNSRRYRAK